MPRVTELLRRYPGRAALGGACENLSVRDITADSREVTAGTLFVAVRGEKQDGARFIPEAIARGASAIVAEEAFPGAEAVCQIVVDNARRAQALFAAAIYAPQPEHMVAVTGTDGKTSTAEFFRQLAEGAGHSSASIGTLGVRSDACKVEAPALNTTPAAPLLHRTLKQLSEAGCRYAAVEASSHGLDQFRLDGVKFRAAAFTNLTADHLDYHGTREAYFAAKRRLFAEVLPEGAAAALNRDDEKYDELAGICRKRGIRVIAFGRHSGADLLLKRATPTARGQDIELAALGTTYACSLGLAGGFQAMNILAALGLAMGCGLELPRLLEQLPRLKGVRGRLEKVAEHPSGAAIYVDYAHTEDALRKLLETLRPHTEKRLAVVFGCGGDRDKSKRPRMGQAASELADMVIVTDDNPRGERPEVIRSEVIAGAKTAKNIGDRAEAIAYAVKMLGEGDVLVIAGKGHETTQTAGDRVLPFDDAEVARKAVAACGA